MHKAGVIAVWLGFFLTILGLLSGFSLMFLDHDDMAMMFMTAAPFGFLFLLGGLVSTQLGQSR